MEDFYNEELIKERGFRCKDCSQLMHQHTFTGDWHKTGAVDRWGNPTTEFRYKNKCDENFRAPGVWYSDLRYPNLLLINKKWYHFSHRASMLALVVKSDVAVTVDRRDSLQSPKPVLIETYGDMYNFAAQQGILEKLKRLVDAETFKSMQSKSIERAMKKLSA